MHSARLGARRLLVRLVVCAALALTAVGFDGHSAGADATTDTWNVLATIQAERAWFGLAPLAVDPALSELAVVHSGQMARAGTIFHTYSLLSVAAVVPGWQQVGENVGMGPSWLWVANAFAHSPEHLRNILGPYNRVGIGTAESQGVVYITEEFARAPR